MNRRTWTPVALVTAVALLFSSCEGADPGAPQGSADQPAERAAFAPGDYGAGDLDAVFSTVAADLMLTMSALLAAYLQSGSEMAASLRESLTTVDPEGAVAKFGF